MSGLQRSAAFRGFAGGLASMFCQGLILRESLYARHEAELAMGLALASWLISSGLGGFLAMRVAGSRSWWAAAVSAMGLAAPAAAWLCRMHLVDPAVASAGSGLLAGAVFALPFGPGARVSLVCAAEAAGAVAGGVLFSCLSASMLLGGLAASAAIVCLGAASTAGGITAFAALLGATAAVLAGLPGRLDLMSAAAPSAGSDSFTIRASARGEVVVAWRSGQASLWRSGRVESYRAAPEAAELLSMVPLAYSGEGRILYIGTSPDMASLLSAWGATDVIVPDSSSRAGILSAAPGVSCVVQDERRAVETADRSYGLVIFQAGLPLSLLSNRMCTLEFFRSARGALTTGGVLAFTMPLSQTRLVPEQEDILGPILAAGRTEFGYSAVFPLGGAAVMLSDDTLPPPSVVVASRWSELEGLSPVFFDSSSLQWELGPERAERWAASLLSREWLPNTDLHPRSFAAASINWETRMGGSPGGAPLRVILVAAVLVLALSVLSMGRRAAVAIVPCALGASSAACETAAILIVQATFGVSWAVLALAPGLFMCGYSFGSAFLGRPDPGISGLAGSAAVAGLAAVCHAYDTGAAGPLALSAGAAVSVLLAGLFSGAAFPSSASRLGGTARGVVLVNAASTAGGALGAVAFPLFLFPSAGAASTLLWTGVVSLLLSGIAIPLLGAGSRGMAVERRSR